MLIQYSWLISVKGNISFPASFSFCNMHKWCTYFEMQEWVIIVGHIFNNGPYNEVGLLHNVNIRSALSGVCEYAVVKEKRRK